MTLFEEHQIRHGAIHEIFEELWEDYVKHFPRAIPQSTTVGQLLAWSRRQVVEPTDPPEENFLCQHCREPIEGPHVCTPVLEIAEGERHDPTRSN